MTLVDSFTQQQVETFDRNVLWKPPRDGARRYGDPSLDGSFFPVLWDETGDRTPWLAALPDID